MKATHRTVFNGRTMVQRKIIKEIKAELRAEPVVETIHSKDKKPVVDKKALRAKLSAELFRTL